MQFTQKCQITSLRTWKTKDSYPSGEATLINEAGRVFIVSVGGDSEGNELGWDQESDGNKIYKCTFEVFITKELKPFIKLVDFDLA